MRVKRGICFFGMFVMFAAVMGVLVYRNRNSPNTSEEAISKVEDVLGEEYQRRSLTEIVATFVYEKQNEADRIYYYVLKTIYYEEEPAEDLGLHTEAFAVLFPVELMESCEEMKIQDWDAAYLCWTQSAEISCVLEYNFRLVEDGEIVRMAESVGVVG